VTGDLVAVLDGPPEVSLVKNRQRSHPGPQKRLKKAARCPVPGLLLHRKGGGFAPLYCGRNSCQRCGGRKADELIYMLGAQSLTHAPDGVMTLTTQDPSAAYVPDLFTKAVEQVIRAIRRRFPELEYLGFIEFTTGVGPKSGGMRRIHAHIFFRGASAIALVEDVARSVWCERMPGTRPERQTVEPIRTPEAMFRYLAAHHLKPSQAPPADWWGKRVRPSRGWWVRPVAELRLEAREAVAFERRVWRARNELGVSADPALIAAYVQDLEASAKGEWVLWRTHTTERGTVVPVGPFTPPAPRSITRRKGGTDVSLSPAGHA